MNIEEQRLQYTYFTGAPPSLIKGGHAPSLRTLAPPVGGGQEVTKSTLFCNLAIYESWPWANLRPLIVKLKKNNWSLVYWAYTILNIPYYTHTQTPFVSETNYCLRSEQVDKVPRCLSLCFFHYAVLFWERERGFKYLLDIFTLSSATYYDIALML